MSEEEKVELANLRETVKKLDGIDLDAILAENARHKEGELIRAASEFIKKELTEKQIPDLTKERLTANLCVNPPLKEGKLDEATLKTKLEEAVNAEIEYLSKIVPSGVIKGMGSQTQVKEADKESLKASFKESLRRQHPDWTDEQLEKGANIAVNGR